MNKITKQQRYTLNNKTRVNASKSWWKYKKTYTEEEAKVKMRNYCQKKNISLDQFKLWFGVDL